MDSTPLDLAGCTVLIVEDDYFLARDTSRAFSQSGADILGPVATVEDALELLRTTTMLSGAVLDINLMGDKVYPVAEVLSKRNVPFVFVTGYDTKEMHPKFAQITCLQKPIDPLMITRVLFEAPSGSTSVDKTRSA